MSGGKRKTAIPSQERLQELFDYSPETGILERRGLAGSHRSDERKHGKYGAGSVGTLGYVMVYVDGVRYNVGQLAWLYQTGEWPRRLYYRNSDKTDNRFANLGNYEAGRFGKIKEEPLTHERVKELLDYNAETGWLTWKEERGRSANFKKGERVGTVSGFGYRHVGLEYKKYIEHRLIWFWMTGEWPDGEIDHINGRKDDNRWSNLRLASKSMQGFNREPNKNAGSGYRGVHLVPVTEGYNSSKWRACITVDGKTVYLGLFDTPWEARVARLEAEKQHFGKFVTFDDRDADLLLFLTHRKTDGP